jgi:SAM-dependent methyltransferase
MYRVRGFPIARCVVCGLGATILPEGFDPTTIYDATYFQGGQDDGYADYKGSEEVLAQEFQSSLRHLRQAGASGGKLFEVGCAYGFFLQQARERFRVAGVELCTEAVEHCQSRGLDVTHGVLSAEALRPHGPLDVAVMLDVIEHLERPDEVLALLAEHTRPGGHLLLTTGDWGALFSRLTGARWRLMTPPQHLWFFSVSNLTRLLEAVGFRVASVEHPWKKVPLGLVSYQLGRMTGLQRLLPTQGFGDLGIPINLFDAMRIVAVRA